MPPSAAQGGEVFEPFCSILEAGRRGGERARKAGVSGGVRRSGVERGRWAGSGRFWRLSMNKRIGSLPWGSACFVGNRHDKSDGGGYLCPPDPSTCYSLTTAEALVNQKEEPARLSQGLSLPLRFLPLRCDRRVDHNLREVPEDRGAARRAARSAVPRAKLFITPARTVSVEDNVDSVADNGSAGRGARGGGAHSAMRPLSPTPGGRMARTVSASGSVFPDATNTTDFT